METKFIICTVKSELRNKFSRAQRAWNVTGGCEGFLSQCGGWDIESGNAVVISTWIDDKSLFQFMRDNHDGIAEMSNQKETYADCSVSYFHDVFHLPAFDLSSRTASEFVRITCCKVRPGSELDFLDVQEKLWNPGMSSCEGMQGGTLWRDSADKYRYLVVSFWRHIKYHQRYVEEVFPKLVHSAKLKQHLMSIQSYKVSVESEWGIFSVA